MYKRQLCGAEGQITNNTGSENIAIGNNAAFCMRSGGCNTFLGESGKYVTTGSHNIGMGKLAGGSAVESSGSYNIALGK